MKRFLLVPLALMLLACSQKSDEPGLPDSADDPTELHRMTNEDYQRVYQDTITPPANPLLPPAETRIAVCGVLADAREPLNNLIYAAIRSVADGHSLYFLRRDQQLVRFDEPMLAPFYLGDTVAVTGILDEEAIGNSCYIEMEAITLVGAYADRH